MKPTRKSPWTPLGLPFVWGIIFYQHTLGHVMGGRCRFHPTCSFYGLEAFRTHAPWHAFWLTSRRVLSCHPWGRHGVDLVPPYKGGCCGAGCCGDSNAGHENEGVSSGADSTS